MMNSYFIKFSKYGSKIKNISSEIFYQKGGGTKLTLASLSPNAPIQRYFDVDLVNGFIDETYSI